MTAVRGSEFHQYLPLSPPIRFLPKNSAKDSATHLCHEEWESRSNEDVHTSLDRPVDLLVHDQWSNRPTQATLVGSTDWF